MWSIKILVSIIIPTYKGKELLDRCSLKSVLNQTYQNFEIFIANDGEDKDTKEYIESLNNPKIKYYEFPKITYKDPKENWAHSGGSSLNRNKCLNLLKGKLIAPLDHDDIWGPNYLKERVEIFKNDPDIDFTYGKAANISKDMHVSTIGNKLTTKIREMYKVRSKHNCIAHCSVVYSARLKHYRYTVDGDTAADYTLWCDIINDGHHIHFIDKIVCLRNGAHNSFDGLDKIYNKLFIEEFKVS